MTTAEWRTSSFSGEDNCVGVKGTLDAVRDTKYPAAVLPAKGLPALVRLVKADRLTPPAS